MRCPSKGTRFSARYAYSDLSNHMMDEQEFRDRADEALDDLYRRLSKAAEQHDFEADFNSGALAIEFESPPAKFVVSPNAPVRQVWVSAHMKSFKLEWEPGRNAFVLPGSGQTLVALLADAIGQQLNKEVSL
jgi:iron donor protein CyaY